jgi:hypothetical protein
MNHNEPIPDRDELIRLTSPRRLRSVDADPTHEAFLALGESAEAAAGGFDWRRIATNLESELAAEVLRPRRVDLAPKRPSWGYVALTSAAILLVALSIGLLSDAPSESRGPHTAEKQGAGAPENVIVNGIDSWERFSSASGDWQDEIDLKLAATRRELRQGRDPWVNDEPVLSEVIAQIGDLNAGLVFDPF